MGHSISEKIAKLLLEKDAIALRPEEPFRFSSGILSPIYCDNRILLSHMKERKLVIEALAEQVKACGVSQVVGVATAGISWGAWVADFLNKPFLYVRSSAKEHGKKNQIEGRLETRGTVAVIEDLISTGGSVLRAVDALREKEANIACVTAIFEYGFPDAEKSFQAKSVSKKVLVNLDTLLHIAVSLNKIQDSQIDLVRAWQKDPKSWNPKARVRESELSRV